MQALIGLQGPLPLEMILVQLMKNYYVFIYLPVYNALSRHVHGFLKQLGQWVQHIPSRVDNLIDFVQRANDYREITNEGTTFRENKFKQHDYVSKMSENNYSVT